jgi:hypothetical protein
VERFVLGFDMGSYPELVDEGPPSPEEMWMDKYGDLD